MNSPLDEHLSFSLDQRHRSDRAQSCVRLALRSSSSALPPKAFGSTSLGNVRKMMMMTFITQRGESQGKTKKERKATKSKGRGLEEGG